MAFSRRSFFAAAGASSAGLLRPVRPRLTVVVIAGQMRADLPEIARRSNFANGFRRLLEEGAWFRDCRLESSSFTSSGLATLVTGAYPESHGIVADRWYDRRLRELARAAADQLQAGTLPGGVEAELQNRVFALGIDSSGTALLAGVRTPVFAVDSAGDFELSGAAPEEFSWFGAFQTASSARAYHDAAWTALGTSSNAPPLRTLAYDPARPGDFAALYKASPFALGAQFVLARELVARESLGQRQGTDLLLVLLGSLALLGHEVGAGSPLMQQMLLHLDRELQATLEALDRNPGAGNYNLVFTAAHGAPEEPPGDRRGRMSVSGEAVARAVDSALSGQLDPAGVRNRYVERYVYPFLYLRQEPFRRSQLDRRRARRLAGEAALDLAGVAGFYTADGDCSHGGEWLRRFRNSFHADRSGDLMLAYRPGYVEDFGAGRGVSYGSLYNYDCRIPLIFYGPPFESRTFDRPVEAIDIVPTLARVLGAAVPSSSTGRVLAEAFTPAKT